MTPQQHLEQAEQLLMSAQYNSGQAYGLSRSDTLTAALCHALIAHVAEAGVPHFQGPPVGGDPGARPLEPRL